MKNLFLILAILLSSIAVFATSDYSERFVKSLAACEPYTEMSQIKDSNGENLPMTKIVQGVKEHSCVYKQVIIRPTVKDITTCTFSKPLTEEIVKAMKEETGERFDVDFNLNGQTIPLRGLTKSQIIWTQLLNSEQICERQIINR